MQKFKYVILQDENKGIRDRAERSRGPTIGPSTLGTGSYSDNDIPADIRVQSDDLTASQAADERNNPNTLAVAREMKLSLINRVETNPFNEDGVTSSGSTWGIDAVRAKESTYNGEGVTVAVLDTGIDSSHPAFSGIDIERKNFTDETDTDIDGHGTHCAGTIFGRDVTVDGTSTRIGVAPGVTKALVGKVIGSGGGTGELLDAITWAMREKAHVISMSLGYDHAGLIKALNEYYPPAAAASELLAVYLENIRQFDTMMAHVYSPLSRELKPIVVAASGNESVANHPTDPFRISASSPSAALHVLTVGALQKQAVDQYQVASFSNTNVDVVAPGVNVISAGINGNLLQSSSGTSMACPHVAGLCALYWQRLFDQGIPPDPDFVKGAVTGSSMTSKIIGNHDPLDVGVGLPKAPL